MAVTTQQLLQPDMGTKLPSHVRKALVEMGSGCNQAAIHLQQAFGFTMHMQSVLDLHRAGGQPGPVSAEVAADLDDLADQHFEQAIVVLARASTRYAVYASRVALAVARNNEPPAPNSQIIRPSEVITAARRFLPPVSFPEQSGPATAVREQNDAIADARKSLIEVISFHLQGDLSCKYDEVDTVAIPKTGDDEPGRTVGFPDAMHAYAGVLVWATSCFSNSPTDRA